MWQRLARWLYRLVPHGYTLLVVGALAVGVIAWRLIGYGLTYGDGVSLWVAGGLALGYATFALAVVRFVPRDRL
jgi:hypothetical protein